MKKWIPLLIMLTSAGCTSLQSVSTTSIPAQRGRRIQSSTDKIIFLGFNFNNDYVDDIVQDLARKCPNGKVEGLLTKQESIDYFLYIVWKSKVSASGYCVGGGVASVPHNGRRPGSDEPEVAE